MWCRCRKVRKALPKCCLMMGDRRRLAVLRRLARVRAIESKQAAWHLAEARSMQLRMLELASRSRSLAADYAERCGKDDTQTLRTLHVFRAQLDIMSAETEAMEEESGRAAELAGRALAIAEHRMEAVADRISVEERRENARQRMRVQQDSGGLARRLQFPNVRSAKETGGCK